MATVGSTSDGVQSLERAFLLLELMAEDGGEVALSRLAVDSGLPLSTIHRLVRTLVARGYVRQLPSRRYVLGPRLIHLGESSSRTLGTWARPHLTALVDAFGETANLAMLDGDRVVYVAQVPSRHSMRMFTEVGRRVHLHCTGSARRCCPSCPPRPRASWWSAAGCPGARR
ncbi:MAG: Transcriptional regulator, IclR family [Modestobacter sp.]|nr:Transcriptional regulator, IclR family [Modestobacter sp.]